MELRRENKGFSLVELIITIAIFSIVGIVVGSFLLSSSRAYSVNANELDIQEEAQLVANQLQEMILDTPLGISYTYVGVDDAGNLVDTYDVPADTVDVDKTNLYIYGEDYYYHIYWNVDEQRLYFVDYVKTPGGFQLNDMTAEGVVLGEYISDFKVDLSRAATDRIVSFHIIFKKPGSDRDYLVSKSVSLRNNITTNKEATDVYDAVGLEFEPVADNLSLSPGSQTVWPGESVVYTVTKTCSRGGVPSQDVNWAYVSEDSTYTTLDSGTYITSGKILQVSEAEESSKIKVTASAQGYNYDSGSEITLSEDAYVNVAQIRSLQIVSNSMDTGTVGPNGRYTIVVSAQGQNLGELVLDEDELEVAISQGSSYVTVVSIEAQSDPTKAKVTLDVAGNTPSGAKIAMTFMLKRNAFSDVYVSTPIYTVAGDNEMLTLTSGSGDEWLRLGSAVTNATFIDEDTKNTYCNADGTLKTGYYLKYVYEVYDSTNCLVKTAYRTTGAGTGSDYTEYFAASGTGSTFSSVVNMTDKVFLTSGTVLVQAFLMNKTDNQPVVAGCSDYCSYTIPQATVGYKRNKYDMPSSKLVSYITKNQQSTPVYITFTSGFASGTSPNLYADLVQITPVELGSVNVDTTQKKISISGSVNANYQTSAGNVLSVKYGGLSNGIKVNLVTANIEGTEYYVPQSQSEWTISAGETDAATGLVRDYYIYYMDDTHKFEISILDNAFESAQYYVMENQQWVYVRDYTMNIVDKTWDINLNP